MGELGVVKDGHVGSLHAAQLGEAQAEVGRVCWQHRLDIKHRGVAVEGVPKRDVWSELHTVGGSYRHALRPRWKFLNLLEYIRQPGPIFAHLQAIAHLSRNPSRPGQKAEEWGARTIAKKEEIVQ